MNVTDDTQDYKKMLEMDEVETSEAQSE